MAPLASSPPCLQPSTTHCDKAHGLASSSALRRASGEVQLQPHSMHQAPVKVTEVAPVMSNLRGQACLFSAWDSSCILRYGQALPACRPLASRLPGAPGLSASALRFLLLDSFGTCTLQEDF